MFSRFAASARRVVQRAFREAKHGQHDFVGTEHLLYGLLCDADGPVAMLLRSLNAAPELMLQKVELSLQRHDAGRAMEQFPLSPASKRVFQSAADEAAQFRHTIVGPEHLLLGILLERDCEAMQILSAHNVTWDAARAAVAQMPPDANREAQVQANEAPRFQLPDNPTAEELERWVAPAIEHEEVKSFMGISYSSRDPAPLQATPAFKEIEAQLRRTQLLLGFLLGYAFGTLMFNWWAGLLTGLMGLLIASPHNSLAGAVFGAGCGYLMGASGRPTVFGAIDPLVLALAGGFLGSFLGDAWRFTVTKRVEQPSADDPGKQDRPE